jgi:ABC-type hemin transport system substrate-binding protein
MYPCAQLARALQSEVLIRSLPDLFLVVESIEQGASNVDILALPELQKWPEAWEWLRARL